MIPKLLFLILFSVSFSHSYSHAQDLPEIKPIRGIENIEEWRGNFKVTKCYSCPDFVRPNGTNLKNLKSFGLDFATVPKQDLPQCATTDLAVAHYFEITSDDNSVTSWLPKHYGLCDWNVGKNFQTLDLGTSFFSYRQQTASADNRIVHQEVFDIQKQSDGKFIVRRIVEGRTETSNYPKRFVYIFEAEKVIPMSH